ncbi:MAG: GlsB/YeaQ/YmgE family stress response membrane protein [Anaerolineae bacterium]|nr:GlsB/YeaQ/YmgE family stress response membrane protein [Anaerolineae bacterium]
MNQAVTITFVPEQLITWIIIGLIAGLLAGILVRGRRYGFISAVVIGLIGAIVGGFIFTIFGLSLPPAFSGGVTLRWSDIVVSFLGAIIVLALFGGFYRARRY